MTESESEQTLEASEDARKKADPLIGQVLNGNYEVIDILGEGGMALVYRGRQVSTERPVALKTLKTRDVNVMRRFQREMQTHGKLNHRNIVDAIDCFEFNEQSFLVMDLVNGISLMDLITRDGGVESEEDIAAILSQICDALDHAHAQTLIHRDLKPANVILMDRPDGEILVKVLDFGIAKMQDDMQKLTAEGQAMGSPLYMSPEQCMGMELSPRADTYSLGILAYELITGNLPYEFPKLVQIMQAHCDPTVKPRNLGAYCPDLKGVDQLNQIIMRAIESEPDKRFQTAGEFKRAIEFWLQGVRTGSPKALPKDILEAAPKKPDAAQKQHDKQTKAAQALVDKKTKQSQTGPQAAQAAKDPNALDTTKLIINFSLGLAVCCVSLGVMAALIFNFEKVKGVWMSASQQVHSVLAKKSEPAAKPAASAPDNPTEAKEVEPNPVQFDENTPDEAVEAAKAPIVRPRRRLMQ